MDFYKGVDISSLLELEDAGVLFYDAAGRYCDALELCQKNGVNSIRLRIWNEPSLVPEAKGYCDLEHTVIFAKRITSPRSTHSRIVSPFVSSMESQSISKN